MPALTARRATAPGIFKPATPLNNAHQGGFSICGLDVTWASAHHVSMSTRTDIRQHGYRRFWNQKGQEEAQAVINARFQALESMAYDSVKISSKSTLVLFLAAPDITVQPGDAILLTDGSIYSLRDGGTASVAGDWVLVRDAAGTNVPSTRTVNGKELSENISLTKDDVALGNVNNTSDADKPISSATQTALNGKAPLTSPTLTGTPTAPTAAPGTVTTQIANTTFVVTAVSGVTALIGQPSGIASLDAGGKVPVAQIPGYSTNLDGGTIL